MQVPVEKKIFGRVDELKRYRQIVDEFTTNQYDLPVVVLVKGDGGIGKSTLELAFREEIADSKTVLYTRIDWENHKDQFIESSNQPGLPLSKQYLKLLCEALKSIQSTSWYTKLLGNGQPFPKYNNALQQEDIVLSKIKDQIEADPNSKTSIEKISSFTKRNSVGLVISALTMNFAGFAQIFAQEALTATEEPFKQFIQTLKKLLTPEEIESLSSASALVDALGDDLADLANRQRMIIAFDTYEVVYPYDQLTRRIIHRAGNNFLWVLVGRKDLFKAQNTVDGFRTGYLEDRDRLYKVHNFDVNQLSNLAIQEWFTSKKSTHQLTGEILEAVRRVTRGIPLALECAYELWQNGDDLTEIEVDESKSHSEIVRLMVQRYNRHCIDDKTQKSLMIVAFADGNLSVLKSCLQAFDPNMEDVVKRIQQLGLNYSAVYAEEYQLHSDPAFFYQEQLKLKLQEEWVQPILDAAIETYCSQLIQLGQDADTLQHRLNESKWQEVVLKLTEIFFWKNDQMGWQWLALRWLEATAFNITFSGQLVNLVKEKCLPYISDRGKSRLKLMAEFSDALVFFYSPKTMSSKLIEELESWKKRKWLNDSWLEQNFNKQREAIYCWQRAKCFLEEDIDQAHKEIVAAMKSTPASDTALKKLMAESIREIGWEFNGQKKDKIAQKLFQASTDYDPDDRSAWMQYAMASAFLEEYDTALEANEQVLVHHKEFAQAYSQRSWILCSKGDHKAAVVSAKKGVELDPQNYLFLKQYIDSLVACNRFEEAIECISKKLDEHDWTSEENCKLRFARADSCKALTPQKFKESIQDYTFVIDLADAADEQKAQALINRGITFGQLSPPQHQDEIEDYTAVINMEGAADEQKAQALINRGIAFGQLSPPQHQDAIADYTAVINMEGAADEQKAQALINRRIAFGQLSPPQHQDAIEDYTAVINMKGAADEQKAQALINRGIAFGQLSPPQHQDEIENYTAVINMEGAADVQKAQALIYRGITFGQLSPPQHQDKIENYTAVINMEGAADVQKAQALINRGITFGQLSPPQHQDEIEDYSAVINMEGAPDEQKAQALINRGLTFGQLSPPQHQDAIADYTAVINMEGAEDEQKAQALINRGIAFGKLSPPQHQDEIENYTAVINMEEASYEQKAQALINRGITFGQLSSPQHQDAIADYTAVINMEGAADVQKAQALINRGIAFGKLSPPQHQDAIEDYTAVINMKGQIQELRTFCWNGIGWEIYRQIKTRNKHFAEIIGQFDVNEICFKLSFANSHNVMYSHTASCLFGMNSDWTSAWSEARQMIGTSKSLPDNITLVDVAEFLGLGYSKGQFEEVYKFIDQAPSALELRSIKIAIQFLDSQNSAVEISDQLNQEVQQVLEIFNSFT